MVTQTSQETALALNSKDILKLADTAMKPSSRLDVDDEDSEQMLPVTIACQSILATVNALAACPDEAKITIAHRIGTILALYSEAGHDAWLANQKIVCLQKNLQKTKQRLAILTQEHFDKSSEKGTPSSAEDEFDLPFDDESELEEFKEPAKGKRARRVSGDTKTVFIEHFPEDMACGTCGHDLKSIKREERVGSLRIIPEHVELVKNVYHTCACNRGSCKDNKPVSAKSKEFIMNGKSLELGFVTEVAVQKFDEHIPIFRLEKRMKNTNVTISRQTFGRNVAHLATYLSPVRDALHSHVMSAHAVHMDETRVAVQNPGKGKCDQSYFWAICRDERRWNPEAQPAVVYHYAPSRRSAVPIDLLSGTSINFLHIDGYAGYNGVLKKDGSNDGITGVKCWAHARRKFKEVWTASKSPLCKRTIRNIAKLYAVEKAAYGLPPHEHEKLRQESSVPVLNEIHAELTKYFQDADGALKAAINYTLKGFEGLRQFAYDGRLEIDNNPVERCIRSIALTRKNSLFAGSHDAGNVWAIYYSLIESANLNRVNPRKYLNWVAGEIERTRGQIDYALLLPWHCPTGRILDS